MPSWRFQALWNKSPHCPKRATETPTRIPTTGFWLRRGAPTRATRSAIVALEMVPSQVFFGERVGARGCFPRRVPPIIPAVSPAHWVRKRSRRREWDWSFQKASGVRSNSRRWTKRAQGRASQRGMARRLKRRGFLERREAPESRKISHIRVRGNIP